MDSPIPYLLALCKELGLPAYSAATTSLPEKYIFIQLASSTPLPNGPALLASDNSISISAIAPTRAEAEKTSRTLIEAIIEAHENATVHAGTSTALAEVVSFPVVLPSVEAARQKASYQCAFTMRLILAS